MAAGSETPSADAPQERVELSFVVIGLNEGERLPGCLASIHAADLADTRTELIYVDGGNFDTDVALMLNRLGHGQEALKSIFKKKMWHSEISHLTSWGRF